MWLKKSIKEYSIGKIRFHKVDYQKNVLSLKERKQQNIRTYFVFSEKNGQNIRFGKVDLRNKETKVFN